MSKIAVRAVCHIVSLSAVVNRNHTSISFCFTRSAVVRVAGSVVHGHQKGIEAYSEGSQQYRT